MRKYETIKTGQRYYGECLKHDDIEPYQTSLALIAANALEESDYHAHLFNYSPESMRERYFIRDGAADAIASMFGLDVSCAREIMQTTSAWLEYLEAKESHNESDPDRF